MKCLVSCWVQNHHAFFRDVSVWWCVGRPVRGRSESWWLFVKFLLLISRACGNLCRMFPDHWSPGNLFIFKKIVFLALCTRPDIWPYRARDLTGRLGPGAVTGALFAPSVSPELSCLCSCKIAASGRSQRHRILWLCLDVVACVLKAPGQRRS